MPDRRTDAPSTPPPLSGIPGAAQDLRLLPQIFESLPGAVLVLDRDWRITSANTLAMRLSRLSPADLGRNHWEIYPETLGTEIETVYRRAMETRSREHLEFFYPPFACWYNLDIVPLDEGGLVFHYSDITETKAAQNARDRALNQLQQVFSASTDSILLIDRAWNITFANENAVRLLEAGPLLGKNLFQLFPGNAADPFFSNYTRTMSERLPSEFEAFYANPLNRWFHVAARPVDDESIILFFRDISDRKLAEQTRDQSLARLNQVFDSTADGILSIDRNWTVRFLNRRAQEILAPAGEIVGKDFWETFPGTLFEGSPYVHAYRRAMDKRIAGSFEAFYPAPLDRHFEIQARPADDGIVLFFRDITERRDSEAALRRQQALLSSIQQAAGVATWTVDLRSGAMTFGTGSASVLGRPLEEITSLERFRDALHPDFRPQLDHNVTESSNSLAGAVLHEYRIQPPDGRTLWIETRAEVVREDGVAMQLRGIALDVTRRKLEEEASAAIEARYRVLVDLNPQAIWSANPTGEITYANQGFLDYLGLAASDLNNWIRTVAPEDHDLVLSAWSHSLRTGEAYIVDARLIRAADNTPHWWKLHGLPVRDDTGNVIQWLGVATDIHEQKCFADTLLHLQEDTERERAELETLYQTAPIGLALFDLDDFRYLRLNDRQAAFFNRTPAEVVGRTLIEMAPIPGLREMFESVAQGTPVINHLLEGELSSHPGEHRVWTVNYFPVYGPDGKVHAVSAASLEITQQKKAEAALVQSEKLAAVGRLASSISHEINNPLEAITNLLYLTSMHQQLPEEVKTYVSLAQAELARVSQIATQTLRFHRQAVRPTRVDAAALVDAVLNLYQGRLNNSGITVDAVFESKTPILCFENDIRQVLNNLIANAIDAMRTGGRLLTRAHDVDDPRTGEPTVRITVADTGHGMSDATLERIFEPFYTTKDLNGTGLGLWISSGIIERHHGRIAVRSSQHPVHHGTVFSLVLPVHAAAPERSS